MKFYSKITASGSHIPTEKICNAHFLASEFYGTDGVKLSKSNEEIIRQFEHITGIKERRYVSHNQVASDIGYLAAKNALERFSIDGETLDYIIVAHNFGDISHDNPRSEFVPSLASRIKHHLQIKNPYTIAYDLPFGCPGWLQGVIQADYFIRSGIAKKIMVIGTETLSRIADPHDRDSMIYSDGAGAVVLEAVESDRPTGVLSHAVKSYTDDLAFVLKMGKSNNPSFPHDFLFLKMQGRVLYEHALRFVPDVIKESLDRAGISIEEVSKVLIHQANEKMDNAILDRFFQTCGIKKATAHIMPMTISWLGNSSVATLPTLYDLLSRGDLENHTIKSGDILVFASVGAGVNINSVVYRVP